MVVMQEDMLREFLQDKTVVPLKPEQTLHQRSQRNFFLDFPTGQQVVTLRRLIDTRAGPSVMTNIVLSKVSYCGFLQHFAQITVFGSSQLVGHPKLSHAERSVLHDGRILVLC